VPQIDAKRLDSEQMDGDRVSGKGIQHEHIEIPWFFLVQDQPRIAVDDVEISAAMIQVAKVLASEWLDQPRTEHWQASCQRHPIERARSVGRRADRCIAFRAPPNELQ
jgi:hypothetical protein